MRFFSKRPYNYLLYLGLLIIIASLFFYKDTVRIHLHDTMYVISIAHYALFCSLIMGLFWLVYRFTWRHLYNNKIGTICALITIVLLLGIFISPLIIRFNPSSTGYYGFEDVQRSGTFWATLFVILGIVQIALFVNVIIGILRSSDVG